MKRTIDVVEQCKSCEGTGLYIGMGERDGAAVVCNQCKGTGRFEYKHEYEEFTERRTRVGVSRVYETNPGIGIGTGNGHTLEEFGGMPVKDWEEGQPFRPGMENRKYTCPAWWYQKANYKLKPEWDKCGCGGMYTFSRCRHFGDKAACWQQWDKEHPEGM